MAQKRKNSRGGVDLTPKQRQAVLVLAVCALVLIATIAAVAVMVTKSHHRGDELLDDSSQDLQDSSAVQTLDLSKYGDAVLSKTDDAGKKYIEETLFVGDTNTYYYYKNALLDLDHTLGVETLKIQDFTTDKSIYFKKDNTAYSIPEAIAKMKPRRVIMMMGTADLDGSMSASEFAEKYKAAVDAIQAAYPHTDLIVAAVPPIPKDHSRAPEADMNTVNEFNEALAQMCVDNNLKFLNITESLLGSDGYGKASCFRPGDLYMKKDGLLSIMDYARCHALDTEDRRPDTNNIPSRRTGTAGNNTDMTDDKEEEEGKTFTAQYNVDKNVGGTLESGDQKGASSLNFKDLEKDSKITVKAVPAKGYKFLKWSDGVTDATRTDKNFKKNINVTAMFTAELTVKIKEGSSATIEEGNAYHLHAVFSDPKVKLSDGDVIWYLDGKEVQKGTAYSPALPKADNPYVIKVVANTQSGKIESGEFKLTVQGKENVYTAKYAAQEGGTLEGEGQKGATLSFGDLKEDSSITVKAVPNSGYKFVKWSDGNTSASRTDQGKTFADGKTIAAIFEKDAPAPTQEPNVEVSIKEGSSGSITVGETIYLHASVTSGNVAADKVSWTLDGAAVQQGMAYSFTPDSAGSYTIKVTATSASGKSATATYTLTVNPKTDPSPDQPETPAPENDGAEPVEPAQEG